jgi:hypothetical protein
MNELRLLAATLLSGMLACAEEGKDEEHDGARLNRAILLARDLIASTPPEAKRGPGN